MTAAAQQTQTTADQVLAAIQARTGKLQALFNGRYRSPSPLRNSDNETVFSLVIHDGEHGAWKDHKTEEGGSLYDLARRLGIEPPTDRPQYRPQEATYSNLDEYAKAHGVEPQVFLDALWKDTTKYGKPAIEFMTKSGPRWRMLAGNAKYMNPTGFKACWYGLNDTARKLIENVPVLVYTNGEASAVVGQHFGVPAFTVAGGGEKVIPQALMAELRLWLGGNPPKVLVALDSDSKGIKAAQQIVDQLTEAGYTAWAVDLGLWEKGDLADFCKLHKQGSFEALLELPKLTAEKAEEAAKMYSPWRVMSIQDLLNLPPVEWYIEGLIQKDAVGMIYGDPGIGKSFFAADVALSLASEGHSVVYNIGEDERGFAERIRAWSHHHSKPPKIIPVVGAVPLLDDAQRETFMQSLGAFNPEVIFIDTVARSMLGGDENSSRDAGMYIQTCEELRHRFGCTVVLIHHTNKGGLQERGSTAFRGAVNFVIRMTESDGLIRVESNKARSAGKFDAMHKRLLPVTFTDTDGRDVSSAVIIDAEKVTQTDQDPLTTNQEKVLRLLSLNIYEDGASRAEIANDLAEMPSSTLTYTLAKLKELAYLDQPGRGRYQISALGVAKLGLEARENETESTPNAKMPTNANYANGGAFELAKEGVGKVGKVGITPPDIDPDDPFQVEAAALGLEFEVEDLPDDDDASPPDQPALPGTPDPTPDPAEYP